MYHSDYGGDYDGGDFDGDNNNNRGEKGEGDGICVVPGADGGSDNDGISNCTVISLIIVVAHMLVVCVMWAALSTAPCREEDGARIL